MTPSLFYGKEILIANTWCQLRVYPISTEFSVLEARKKSEGMTTRLIGSLVMVHSDDDGLIVPPRIATSQIVILPVIHKEETKKEVLGFCHSLAGELRHIHYDGRPLSVYVDEREMGGVDKLWGWVKKGVPLRLEIGPKDIARNGVTLFRRDLPPRESKQITREEMLQNVTKILDEMQHNLFTKAKTFRDANLKKIDSKEEFYQFFTPKNKEKARDSRRLCLHPLVRRARHRRSSAR